MEVVSRGDKERWFVRVLVVMMIDWRLTLFDGWITDYAAADAVVEYTHRYQDLFYDVGEEA